MEIGGALEPTGKVGHEIESCAGAPDHASCPRHALNRASSKDDEGGAPAPEK